MIEQEDRKHESDISFCHKFFHAFRFKEKTSSMDLSRTIGVSIDLETTGFSPFKDNIIQIGAVAFRCWKTFEEISRFRVYVSLKNGVTLSKKIQSLTGISQETLEKEGITEKRAIRALHCWVTGIRRDPKHYKSPGDTERIVFVGQNIHMFDAPYIIRSFHRLGVREMFPVDYIFDIIHLTKKVSSLKSRKLGSVYEIACGRKLDGAHDAVVDALAVVSIIKSPWFLKECGSIASLFAYFIDRNIVMNTYMERYWRLCKLRDYTPSDPMSRQNACKLCGEYVSPYFEHSHTI